MTYPDTPRPTSADEDMSPGSPRWYLVRMVQRLMGRQARYRKLERYALGDHPYPNGDRRFVAALGDLQRKSRTNYIELVNKAVTNRMAVRSFKFGDGDGTDADAESIWSYNNMDLQQHMIHNTGATFGDAYILVSPPDPEDPNGEPIFTAEDPKGCITEPHPMYPTRTLAGLKIWQDDVDGLIYAALYLPESVLLYSSPGMSQNTFTDGATLTKILISQPSEGGFSLVSTQPNEVGVVPLIRGNWQPAFGVLGRGEAECVFDIQDRINHTILDRLVIAKAQAYNQRWATGIPDPKKNPNNNQTSFRPGADAVWAITDPDGKFGQFEAADLNQMLQAIRDDVGDMAAVSQTPASFLMNRMVNVSGDTLTQDQSALVQKVKQRELSMGWMYEQAMRVAFLFKGDAAKATEPKVMTIWVDPEVRALSEKADAFNKLVTGGLPLQIAMRDLGYSQEDIDFAVAEQEKQQQLDMQMQQQQIDAQGQQQADQQGHEMNVTKENNQSQQKLAKQNNDAKLQQTKAAAAAKPKPKPKSSGSSGK